MNDNDAPTIAVVDPDRMTCMLLREICLAGSWNFVGCAHDVHDGLALLARTRPDYCITEYKFAGAGTGLDLIGQAKTMLPDLVTILLTGWDINDIAAHVTTHQPDRILRKPVPPHVLMDLLEAVDGRVERIRIEAV